jgi:hypothetical protein
MSVITQHNSLMIQALKRKGYVSTSIDEEIETGFEQILIGRSHIHFANIYEDGSFHLYGTHLDGSSAYDSGHLHGCSEDEFMTFLSVWLDNFN